MFYSYHERTMPVASWEDGNEVEQPSYYHTKMLIAFFNVTGAFLTDILPEGANMNTAYFALNVISALTQPCYRNERQPHERKVMLHFDNAPTHCLDTVRDRITLRELERIEQSPYRTGRVPCHFFLFRCLKGMSAERQCETPEDLFSEVRGIIQGISQDLRRKIQEAWKMRLQESWKSGGERAE
jgi:hypothetical protein